MLEPISYAKYNEGVTLLAFIPMTPNSTETVSTHWSGTRYCETTSIAKQSE